MPKLDTQRRERLLCCMWNVFYAGYWTDLNILKDTFKGLGATLPPYYRSWNESVLGVMLGNHPSYGHHKESYVCAKYFSCGWLFVTPWTAAYQAPLSMEFSRQENWSGLSFPSPGDLPDPRRSNQSIFKEINPVYSLKGLVLKLQHFGYLTWRASSLEKTLMLRKIEG